LSQADRLREDAETAAEVRKLSNHPDVIALRTEKVRGQVDAGIWIGILLGLAFTMVNVRSFAAALASLPWIAAWLLDPWCRSCSFLSSWEKHTPTVGVLLRGSVSRPSPCAGP
jgi:hypothetical protein